MHKDFLIREEALRDVLAIFDSKFRLKNVNRRTISDTSHYKYTIFNNDDEVEGVTNIHILYAYSHQIASGVGKYKWQFNLQQTGTMELIESMQADNSDDSDDWIVFCCYLDDKLHIGMFRFEEIWDYIKYKTAVNIYYDAKTMKFRVRGCIASEARCNFQSYYDDFSAAIDKIFYSSKENKGKE